MKKTSTSIGLLGLLLCCLPAVAADNAERIVRNIHFPAGSSATTLKGSIRGYHYIDYRLTAGAGQRLQVQLTGSNRMNYFNLLPPDTTDSAMFAGTLGDNRFDGVLPDDGTYTLRVYLMRAGARRGERSDFSLDVKLDGERLPPLPAKDDALIEGTRYHARALVSCQPAYTQTRECMANVIRRDFAGTATVVLQWDKTARRILFVKGAPRAADSPQEMRFTRNERNDYVVTFGDDERFVIPEAVIFGG